MAQPTFMPEGTAPAIGDTQLRAWKKILATYQNSGGLAVNNPLPNDTLKVTKEKVLCAQNSTAYGT